MKDLAGSAWRNFSTRQNRDARNPRLDDRRVHLGDLQRGCALYQIGEATVIWQVEDRMLPWVFSSPCRQSELPSARLQNQCDDHNLLYRRGDPESSFAGSLDRFDSLDRLSLVGCGLV